jgi:L-asparaginase
MGGVCSADEPLTMLHLLFTGGTISMQRDRAAGGNVPAHKGEALIQFAGELDRISPYRVENWAMVPACHLGPDRLWELRERVREVADSGEVAGIVITHGTDIMEESAYLLDRTLSEAVPIAITGAMRTYGDDEWDGARNLRDAVLVAANPESRGRGVMVVFHGKVFAGRTAVKVHTTDVDAFAAPYSAPIGRVAGGSVLYSEAPAGAGPAKNGSLPLEPPKKLQARVALIPVIVGDTGEMLDLARPSHDGVVIVAFGSGNVPPGAVPAIRRWINDRKPVVLASRCPLGVVSPTYAFDGGGSQLVRMGAIPAGSRTPSQARMELMLALSAGVAYGT